MTDDIIYATWNVNLMCDCPNCEEYVDLTEADDFWCDRKLEPCQSGPLDVVCPKCYHEFTVEMEY